MTKEIEEEKPFRPKPQTVKRDRSVHQGATEPEEIRQEEIQGADLSLGFGRYRNGHKGQITKAIAQRRRKRPMSKASRRVNRRRAA